MPFVNSVSISTDKKSLTFTGTNLLLSGFLALVNFTGVAANTVTVISSTSVTAFWSNGVPISYNATYPVLYYTS